MCLRYNCDGRTASHRVGQGESSRQRGGQQGGLPHAKVYRQRLGSREEPTDPAQRERPTISNATNCLQASSRCACSASDLMRWVIMSGTGAPASSAMVRS